MRDPKRCEIFCRQLAEIWAKEFPDWRFSQLMINIISSCPSDPWFWEEDKMMDYIKDYAINLKR